jgi:tetratricopeptide (TPR) repeat protein
VARVLERAGLGARSTLPFAFDKPFDTPANAERAYTWLRAAESRRTALGEQPVPLRVNLALAAWYRGTPKPEDVETVVRLTGELLPPRDPKELNGVDLVALWIVRGAALAAQNPKLAFDAYLEALAAAKSLSADRRDPRAVSLVTSILAPAAELGVKLVADGDTAVKPDVAAVCAEEARLIRDHSRAEWKLQGSPEQKVYDLYKQASDYDRKPEYYAERGKARLLLPPSADPQADLKKVRDDAVLLGTLDKNFPGGWELKGLVDLWLSRLQVGAAERRELLQQAIAEYDEAIRLIRLKNPLDGDLPVLLTNRSTTCLELGNVSTDPKERSKWLQQAREDAAEAILPKYNHPSFQKLEEAQLALGHALEDIGMMTETDLKMKQERYKEAIAAFEQALNIQDDDAIALNASARTRIRWVRDAEGDPATLLPEARTALQKVLTIKAAPVEKARARDWLATAALAENKPAEADKEFAETANLIDPKSKPLVVYALSSVETFKTEAKSGKNLDVLTQAVRARMNRLTGLKGAEKAARVTALAWSHEVEGHPEKALTEYNRALEGSLDRPGPEDLAWVLPLMLARGELQRVHKAALKPAWALVCKDAERAVALAKPPEVSVETQARANGFLGDAWDERAEEALNKDQDVPQAVAATRSSIAPYEKAIELRPDIRPSIRWRHRLACNMVTLAGDKNLDEATRRKEVQTARDLLKKARDMTRPEDNQLRADIDKELAKQKQLFPKYVND